VVVARVALLLVDQVDIKTVPLVLGLQVNLGDLLSETGGLRLPCSVVLVSEHREAGGHELQLRVLLESRCLVARGEPGLL